MLTGSIIMFEINVKNLWSHIAMAGSICILKQLLLCFLHPFVQDESTKELENNADEADNVKMNDGYSETRGTPQMGELDVANDTGDVEMNHGVGEKSGATVKHGDDGYGAMAEVKVADLQVVEIRDSPVKENRESEAVVVSTPKEKELRPEKPKGKAKAKAKGAAKAKGRATKGKKPATGAKGKTKNKKATKEKKNKKTVKPKAKAKASSSKRPAAKIDPVAKKMHSVTRRSQLSDAILQGGKLQCLTWKT